MMMTKNTVIKYVKKSFVKMLIVFVISVVC